MKEDTRISQKDIDEAVVHLKPIFGIAPGRYLLALYILGLVAALFLILLFPGLRKPGAVYRIESDPPGSTIALDGVYRASTPAKLFLPAGTRTIKIDHPFFNPKEQEILVRPRLFGSLFFTKVTQLKIRLDADPESGSPLSSGMKEYSWWAIAGQPSEAYQIPMVLSEAALAWTAFGQTGQKAELFRTKKDFISAALSYTGSPQSARDALRAAMLVSGESAALTPVSLSLSVDTVMSLLSEDPAILPALVMVLPPEISSTIEGTNFYRKLRDSIAKTASAAKHPEPGLQRQAAGISFIDIKEGLTVIRTNPSIPAVTRVEAFALAQTETTVGQYRDFIRENPQWSSSAIETLRTAGLVDAQYLKDFDLANSDEPVRYVSKPAAEAFAAWLSAKAPAGYRLALPTEAQWNRAAEASSLGLVRPDAAALFGQGRTGPSPVSALRTDGGGFKGLLGSVWEWCSDSFTAHPGINPASREVFPAHDGLVRGGSWANRADLVDLNSRGPLSPESCNAYTGFRLVLVPAKD